VISPDRATHQAIEAVWRIECARIVATVARMTRDLGLAEECAQEALVSALEHWPRSGVPDNPAAWLTTAAKRKALDQLRHHQLTLRKHEEIGHDLEAMEALIVPDFVDALDAARQDSVGDDLLRLIFIACHPVLSTDARVALTLRLLGGLSTDEIARAFLVPEPTIAQRIVRAKKTLAAAQVPFELPAREALAERLASVLEVVYLVFNEGYTATQGDEWMRPALCDEALRLARVLAELAGYEPEVQGLAALLELQASRSAARLDAQGRPVLLSDQDRRRWDRLLIRRGLAALDRCRGLCVQRGEPLGPYALQAAIAACHAQALRAEDTDWSSIVALYDAMLQAAPSPVVALNRAVAVSMAFGPAEALPLVEQLGADPKLKGYHWLPSVRADLLARLGRVDEARAALQEATALARNGAERLLLLERAAALKPAH
jgi:RNA polymerase sigma factor (sigma-70 family)